MGVKKIGFFSNPGINYGIADLWRVQIRGEHNDREGQHVGRVGRREYALDVLMVFLLLFMLPSYRVQWSWVTKKIGPMVIGSFYTRFTLTVFFLINTI